MIICEQTHDPSYTTTTNKQYSKSLGKGIVRRRHIYAHISVYNVRGFITEHTNHS